MFDRLMCVDARRRCLPLTLHHPSAIQRSFMSADDVSAGRDGRDALQFDRVETSGAPSGQGAESPAVICEMCGRSAGTEYYHVNGKPVCENCRQVLRSAAETPRTAGPLVRAGVLGLVAAIAGAAIYYAVIAITNFEIGLVAILIGYMVGYMVRRGAGGRGGRRFQILAVVLTYWAVGLAYTPLAFKGLTDDKTAAADSTSVAETTDTAVSLPSTDSSALVASSVSDAPGDSSDDGKRTSAVKALGMVFLLVFALPVLSIVESMPGGILSALIIFIGLRQAWTMTGAHVFNVSGPYKVGAGPASSSPATP